MSFSPHDHLVRQGWKGKGTAFKNGHATRPIPVVQKKTMSGIGKDRDEAIPFWDHIFASTAASIASSASGTSTPKPAAAPKLPTLSIAQRSGKEIAKRQLYSGFFRGTKLSAEHTPRGTDDEKAESSASGSGSGSSSSSGVGGTPVATTLSKPVSASGLRRAISADVLEAKAHKDRTSKVKESREDRHARKTAKRADKERKELAKVDKAAKRAERAARRQLRLEKKEKKAADGGDDGDVVMGGDKEEKKEKKDKKAKKEKESKEDKDARNAEKKALKATNGE